MKHHKTLRRGLSVLLSLVMCLSLLPATALAEGTSVAIDATNFPDENFRTYVSENFDTDGPKDNMLSAEEIAAATEIDCSDSGIESLKGIEYFTALTTLTCSDNNLGSLDVSKNTALKELYCRNTWLKNLDVSSNTALEHLECGTNYLTSLDVSKNNELQQLVCDANNLTSLDVSKNTALAYLNCDNNTYDIKLGENRTFNLSTLPEGFEVSKVISWTGGTVDNGILTFDSDVVTYTYNCGYKEPVTFTLDARTKYTVTVYGGLYGELGMSGLPCGKDGIWGTYVEREKVDLYIGTRVDSGYTLEGLEFDGIAANDFTWDVYQYAETIQRCGHFTMPANDVTVTVKWKKTNETPETKFVVTFDPNGGTLKSGTHSATETEEDGTVDYLSVATREGYTFDGWYTEATGGEKVYTYITKFTADTTVYAHWTPVAQTKQITEASFAMKGYTVGANAEDIVVSSNTEGLSLIGGYFEALGQPYSYLLGTDIDANGEPQSIVTGPLEAGKEYILMLKADVNAGYDGSGLTAGHVILNGTIAANECGENKEESSIGCTFVLPVLTEDDNPDAKYTITFDPNGGSGSMVDVTGVSGSYTLPANGFTPPAGKQFKGWATSASGEVISGNTITVTENTILYAIWEDIPAATEYNITVTDGKATVGADTEISKAAEGTTVTLTANEAPAGKVFDKWVVESGSMTLADANSATTTFTMPASAVSVKATYKDASNTHNLSLVPATPATCITPGNKAYYTCDGCDKWFEDATGSVEITDKTSVFIPATDHTPSDWKSDATNHWKECSCGDKTEIAIHDFGKDNVCDTCGYKKAAVPSFDGEDDDDSYYSNTRETSVGHWIQDEKGWWYSYNNGTWPSNGWAYLPWQGVYYWYYFNADGYMAVNWLDWNSNRYYLNSVIGTNSGMMMTGWQEIGDKWYYFNPEKGSLEGILFRNTTTPDGYQVGADGVWIQ